MVHIPGLAFPVRGRLLVNLLLSVTESAAARSPGLWTRKVHFANLYLLESLLM